MKKKVELLAPAGNFQCFSAAIKAGADAVYLGGSRYGARAYADNFTDEEVVHAIHMAHLFHRRVYLTVNTLAKEDELAGLVEYMTPFYEAGLDGVIIQDFGVFLTLKEHFPGMELHASTQMTLTGKYGAKYLKDLGACRIVPARELSLEEIRSIKEDVDIEIEAFIHGAMCYAYSGQCLYSSILGGRSGNRGRCAGPCRLPFHCDGKDEYPLSLKDMYTLPYVGELIEAGIDSFKIEGRMKSAEYVAGVTSVYRKYIDQYYEEKEHDPDDTGKVKVTKKDESIVKGLYMRTGLHEGYYYKHNGKEMVTLQGGSYAGTDDSVLAEIKAKYVEQKPELFVHCKAEFYVGKPARMQITMDQKMNSFGNDQNPEPIDVSICVEGDEVQQAQKRPLTKEDILKQLQKSGDTYFKALDIDVQTDDSIFMPVKSLNELRRKAYDELENKLLASYLRKYNLQQESNHNTIQNQNLISEHSSLSVLITTEDQLREAGKHLQEIDKLYIDIDLFSNKDNLFFIQDLSKRNEVNHADKLYLTLPYILRKRSYRYLEEYKVILGLCDESMHNLFQGVLIRNLEELEWIRQIEYKGELIADANIYIFNQKTKHFFEKQFSTLTAPVELNRKEKKQLDINNMENVVYGRIPMMYTANCTRKTLAVCNGVTGFDTLKDRYNNIVPVFHNCKHCYNVVYNSVPLSLHQYVSDLKKDGVSSFRLEFTTETAADMGKMISCYHELLVQADVQKKKEAKKEFILEPGSYTTGHYKRGVE